MKFFEETEECRIRRTCAKILKVLGEIKRESAKRNVCKDRPTKPIRLSNGDEVFLTNAAREEDIAQYCRRLANGKWLCGEKLHRRKMEKED